MLEWFPKQYTIYSNAGKMKTHPASELSKLTLMALACMPAPVASCATKVRWWQKADNGLQWWMMTLVTLSGAAQCSDLVQ